MDLFLGNRYHKSESNGFTRFVLSNKPFSTQDFDKLHLELAKDPNATGLLLTSEINRALFLSDFSEHIQRIITWLKRIEANVTSKNPFNKDIIHNFAFHLVVPLLDSSYSEFFPTCGFPELIVSTIQLSYVYRSRSAGPKTHKILLERVSKISDLIQRILPSVDGAKVIQTILAEAQSGAEIRSFGTVQTLAEWTKVAVKLCQGYCANHCVKAELGRWSSLLELQNALTRVLTRRTQVPQLPQLATSQYGTTPASPQGVPLTVADFRALELFNIRPPAGIGAVQAIIERLQEKETFQLFRAFVQSFPCAACLRTNTGTSDSSLVTRANPLSFSALPDSFTGTLLGSKLGPWRVCLSGKAFEDTLALNKHVHFKALARKLRELASGNWDHKSLRMPLSREMLQKAYAEERVPLWTAEYESNGRILWQINVGFDEDDGTDCQIISVWRIGDINEIRESIRDALRLQKAYTTSDIHRRHVSLLQFPVLPKQYYDPVEQESYDAEVDETVLGAQENLMSNKMYCVTGKVLYRIFTAPESAHVEFPFDLSREQIEIIKQSDSAAFILGRSGTGKTTCLLYKLLWRNIASRQNGTTVRQIFLTQSACLAQKLQAYLEQLMASQFPGSAKRSDELKVAQNKPLELLTLENIDDDKFPIVCTFDDLFNFLEKNITFNDCKDLMDRRSGEVTITRKVARVINYNIYRDQYWQKYDYKEGFEPNLVFSEILGVIKGSTSPERNFQPLSKKEYLELSARKAPNFVDVRSTIYNIYQNYERKKCSLGDRDDIDRVISLWRSLEEDQNLKRSVQSLFDEVYVNEVHDNKLLEIDLLLTLVRNPHGIHFAGDTAQCISRDNTFRFQDAKARFYERFIAMANEARQISWARPELFLLAKNYRSHQGILSLAADILQMLYNGFPAQIDILPCEVGTYPGTKPTMFVGFDYTILARASAGTAGTEAGPACFGAEQVIIVRDDVAKQKLRKELKLPLILTISQSKVLEFDDVILYNFFSDSMWTNIGMPVLNSLLDKRASEWLDNRKYGGLCTELKHLYVAVTRARNNLWMVESDPGSVQNIIKLWTRVAELKEPLISVVHNSLEGEHEARNIIKPGKSTDAKAWKERGELLLHEGLYEDALLSFRRAQHQQGQDLANAYLLYEEASGLDVGQSNELSPQAIDLFLNAAKLFEDASFMQKAVETYAAVGNYIKAAEVLEAVDYGKAGIWYERAGEFPKAANCYHMAKQYDNAVIAYRRGEHFAELIAYLNQHHNHISVDVQKQYSALINILLQRGDLSEVLLPSAIDTLGDSKEKEEFYKRFDRTDDLLAFYKKKMKYYDAFKVSLDHGMFDFAIQLAEEPQALIGLEFSIPVNDMLILCNGWMAQSAWSSVGLKDAHFSASAINIGKATGPVLREVQVGWEQLLGSIHQRGKLLVLPRPMPDQHSGNFFQEFGNDFLDLVELVHLGNLHDAIDQVNEAAELPVATLSRFAILAGDLLAKAALPPTLLAGIGALLIPNLQNEAIVLNWSPLFPRLSLAASNSTELHTEGYIGTTLVRVQETFSDWLISLVAPTVTSVLTRLRELKKEKSPCFQFLQGECHRYGMECKFRHTKLLPDEVRANILTMLQVTGLACSLDRLYYYRKLAELESKVYKPNKHYFLEKLLRELTFISPLLNDGPAQEEVWNMILAKEGQWFHVRDGLESLFFHRLKGRPEEWQKRGTISALLEEWSFASKLGIMRRFLEFLQRRVRAISSRNFLADCESLQPYTVSNLSTAEMIRRILCVTEYITSRDFSELRSFHAVLTLFEMLSLELLNRSTRLELLVPKSRHHFIRDLSNTTLPTKGERYALDSCLVRILRMLCEHLLYFADEYWRLQSQRGCGSRINLESLSPEALFAACGLSLRDGNRYMIRRGLDHLALCMINMGLDRTPPSGYNELRMQIFQVYQRWEFLKPPTIVNWTKASTPGLLAYELVEAYRKYNKDVLVILEGSKTGRNRSSRFQFLIARGIQVLSREQLVAPQYSTSHTQRPENAQGSDQTREERAATTIARSWKRCAIQTREERAARIIARFWKRAIQTREERATTIIARFWKRAIQTREERAATIIARFWKRCAIMLQTRKERTIARAKKLASGPQGEAEVIDQTREERAATIIARFWKRAIQTREERAATTIARFWKRGAIMLQMRKEGTIARAKKLASGPQGEAEVIIDDIIAHGLRPRYWYQRCILETRGLQLVKGIIELGQLVDTTHELAMTVLTGSMRGGKLSTLFVEQVIGVLDKRKRYIEKTKAIFTQSDEQNLLEMAPETLEKKISTAFQTLGQYEKEVEKWKTRILDGMAEGEEL
ncbi:hypothetical protein BDZ91DRAFT_798572 [Kalaharituber pfeilii]|nr:hypothetical protein BDZ91DRAFT_798572 [Kalaharituber pfeilii]